MKMSMKLQGFEKLAQQLKGMPDKLMRQTIAPAVKESTEVMANAMRTKVPVDQGWIKKSIAVYSDTGKQYRKFKRFNPKTVVSYIAGPIKPVVPAGAVTSSKRGKLSMKKIRPYWAIFVEKGTRSEFPIKIKSAKVLAGFVSEGGRKGKAYSISRYQKNASYFRRGRNLSSNYKFFGKEVKGRGQVARPFVRPAFDSNVNNTINKMRTELDLGIQRAMVP